MLSKTHPPKQRLSSAASGRVRSTHITRIAHELINQLSVINLVGYNVVARNQSRSAAEIARDTERFQGSMAAATLLAEQLAHYLASNQAYLPDEPARAVPAEGQVVRLLRAVTAIKR